MTDVVTLEKVGATGLIAFDNPPVNAASHALRQAFQDCLETAAADPEINVIALYGKGRSFVAGADIREFGTVPQAPILPTIINRMEEIATPVIAIIHGVALGGGLEIALGAQARIGVGRVRVAGSRRSRFFEEQACAVCLKLTAHTHAFGGRVKRVCRAAEGELVAPQQARARLDLPAPLARCRAVWRDPRAPLLCRAVRQGPYA